MSNLAPDQPRIIGSEMEYGLLSYQELELENAEGAKQLVLRDDWPKTTNVFNCLPSWFVHVSGFSINGCRFYIDVGNHPEYATGECLSLDDLVIHETAGELITYRIFEHIRQQKNTKLAKFILDKSVADDVGSYWGYHENYQFGAIEKIDFVEEVIPELAPHVATRGILFGAGHTGEKYQTTQKGLDVGTLWDAAASTRGKRPLIDGKRDEPHADPKLWRRIHITSGDANMLPWATWMKFGTTSVVLRMIEAGIDLSDLHLHNAVKAVHTVAHDTSLHSTIALANGQQTTAIKLQAELADRAAKFAKDYPLTDEENEVIEEWQAVCADLQQNCELGYGRVEWITKRKTLVDYGARKDIPYGHPKLQAINHLWANIDPDAIGGAQSLRRKNILAKTPDPAAVERAILEPPQTRAALRGRFIGALVASHSHGRVSWSSVSLDKQTFRIPDPAQTTTPRMEALIHHLERRAQRLACQKQ